MTHSEYLKFVNSEWCGVPMLGQVKGKVFYTFCGVTVHGWFWLYLKSASAGIYNAEYVQ